MHNRGLNSMSIYLVRKHVDKIERHPERVTVEKMKEDSRNSFLQMKLNVYIHRIMGMLIAKNQLKKTMLIKIGITIKHKSVSWSKIKLSTDISHTNREGHERRVLLQLVVLVQPTVRSEFERISPDRRVHVTLVEVG